MASRTSSSSARRDSGGSAWGAFLAGLASVATLPLAVFLTRFSESYELLHAGFAIPIALVLGLLGLRMAGRQRRRQLVSLAPSGPDRVATAARVLGGLGICMALAGVVALVVYGLLEYAGTR
jgi:hypothetical protein